MSLRGGRIESAAHVPIDRFLIVGIDDRQFALPADLVRGLLTVQERDSVNRLAVHGQEYAALDLADRLGLVQVADGPETRMVLLAQAGIQVCIRADQVHGLVEVERTHVLPLPRQFRSEERHWYAGLILYGGGVAIGLHPRWLLSGVMQGYGEMLIQPQRVPLCLLDASGSMRKGIVC